LRNTLKRVRNGVETGSVENTLLWRSRFDPQEGLAIGAELRALALVVLVAACLPGAALALGENSLKAQAAADAATEPAKNAPAGNPYGDSSDEELTVLAANWDALGQQERRALLTEMKRRMARKGDHSGVIRIRTERRYGRIIRQPDGRVIRIETQVVHVRPLDEGDIEAPARQGYGVGFERRVARRGESGSESADAGNSERGPEVSVPNVLLEGRDPLPPTPLRDPLPVYRASDPAP
jgi:hypothetical protein